MPPARLADHPHCGKCKKPLFNGQPIDISGALFDQLIRATDVPVVVDFWAPWCGPCRTMAPNFAAATAALEPRVRCVRVNSDEAPGVAERFNIRSIPTLVVLKNGIEVARQTGAGSSAALIQWITQHSA